MTLPLPTDSSSRAQSDAQPDVQPYSVSQLPKQQKLTGIPDLSARIEGVLLWKPSPLPLKPYPSG